MADRAEQKSQQQPVKEAGLRRREEEEGGAVANQNEFIGNDTPRFNRHNRHMNETKQSKAKHKTGGSRKTVRGGE